MQLFTRQCPPGAVSDSKANAYCVVASALDKLGNESAQPDPDEDDATCKMAGTASVEADAMAEPAIAAAPATEYAALAEAYADAKEAKDDAAIATAEAALANVGLRAGLDITPPAADWAGTSLASNAKALNIDAVDAETPVLQYILHLTDNRGLRVAEPVVDSLELRDDDGEIGVMTLPG